MLIEIFAKFTIYLQSLNIALSELCCSSNDLSSDDMVAEKDCPSGDAVSQSSCESGDSFVGAGPRTLTSVLKRLSNILDRRSQVFLNYSCVEI